MRSTRFAALILTLPLLAACGRPSRVMTLDAALGRVRLVENVTTTTAPPPPPTTTTWVAHASRQPPRASRAGGTCDRPSTCPQLRQCENGGSYAAGSNPRYYGAYQFADRSTWGMSPAEQDAHADEMYRQRGAQPWPVCGRYLR